MSFAPETDFLALLRQTSGGLRVERMPGLDWLVAELQRTGMFSLWVGQTPPLTNQASTVWLKPSYPSSWVAEGTVYIYSVPDGAYEPATPALWASLFAGLSSQTVFQAVTMANDTVAPATSLLAVERVGPIATALTLPSVGLRSSRPLQIVDWSSALAADHTITLSPAGGETIMKLASFQLVSTPDQLAGVTLYPSTDLLAWVIAP